jgi:hypothetical protein
MQNPTTSAAEDPELVFIEGLAQEVVRLYDLKQIIFETDYRWQYRHNHPDASGCILKFVSFQATRRYKKTSLDEALRNIVTSQEEARGQAIRFRVRLRAKEIIAALEPKKKKKKKVVYVPPSISKSNVRKMKMYVDLLNSEPKLPGDDEPDFNPSDETAWSFPLTVAEIRSLAENIKKRDEQMRLTENEFLSESPIPKTVEFGFVTKQFGPARRDENDRRRRSTRARV